MVLTVGNIISWLLTPEERLPTILNRQDKRDLTGR